MKIDTSLMFEPARLGALAATLEQAGFDGAYTFEGQSDPFIGLSAAAMGSRKLELMTAIAVAFSRNPMNLAYLGNDLQNLSGGRFTLGLGTQVKAHIEHRFSMPWSHPAARMREMVQAIRAIWSCWQRGEPLNFRGEFYHHTLMSPIFSPPPTPYGPPPIFIAGVGPKMTEVAAEVGDGYFLHPFNSEHSLQTLSEPALARGLEQAGKTRSAFQVSAQVITATGLNDEEMAQSIASARQQIAFYASTPAYLPILQCHGWESLQAEASQLARQNRWSELNGLIDDTILHTFAVVGTPQAVGQEIVRRYHGHIDRVSPVIYQPHVEQLRAVLHGIRQALPASQKDTLS